MLKKLFCAVVVLAVALPVQGAYVVRISDLQYSPAPPNPIKVAGRVTSVAPLKLTDGTGEVLVTGVTGEVGDFMVAEGDFASGVLAVSQDRQKGTLYAPPAMTEMVYIPAGPFLMGNSGTGDDAEHGNDDEFPQHEVPLTGYWIAKYEVTRGEYRQFMAAGGYDNPAYWSADGWSWKVANGRVKPFAWAAEQDWGALCFYPPQPFVQTDAHPVVGTTYYEAAAYCAWAGGHLPTEAQWEKAARWAGGHPNVYPWGSAWDAEKSNNYLDHNASCGGYQAHQTAPVGSYPLGASPSGCQDVAGNVWEWCADWYGASYYSMNPSPDPQGPTSGSCRALRGGSWFCASYYPGNYDRCATRNCDNPDSFWNPSYGLRISR